MNPAESLAKLALAQAITRWLDYSLLWTPSHALTYEHDPAYPMPRKTVVNRRTHAQASVRRGVFPRHLTARHLP